MFCSPCETFISGWNNVISMYASARCVWCVKVLKTIFFCSSCFCLLELFSFFPLYLSFFLFADIIFLYELSDFVVCYVTNIYSNQTHCSLTEVKEFSFFATTSTIALPIKSNTITNVHKCEHRNKYSKTETNEHTTKQKREEKSSSSRKIREEI